MLDIKVVGDKKLAEHLKKAAKRLQPKLRATMQKATYLVQRKAKEKLSGQVLRVRSGRLRSSITAKISGQGANIQGRVGTNVVYGRLWEKGGTIRAHTIKPKRGKALRFFYQGALIFCKVANIPARKVKARPFLGPALEEKREAILAMFNKVVAEVTR